MAIRTQIIDVTRKPSKCPVCGGEITDIIYGTGDMEEWEFLMQYRKTAIMGGDNIPRRPPVWACTAGCKRFRKVNPDGTDAPVKVKLLKNVRPAPISTINWESDGTVAAMESGDLESIKHYRVEVTTEYDEHETLTVTAVSENDAEDTARSIIEKGVLGLEGSFCKSADAFEIED